METYQPPHAAFSPSGFLQNFFDPLESKEHAREATSITMRL
jgi:hypothetical protein